MKGENIRKPKLKRRFEHYLISPYKNLRFLHIAIYVKQKFTILVATQKSEIYCTAKVCLLFRLTYAVLSLILSSEKMKWQKPRVSEGSTL